MSYYIKDFIPPILLRYGRRLIKRRYGWHGDYKTWADALEASSGYDSEIILEKVKISLLKVKNGTAVFERDSILFDKIQYSWPITSGLMWAASSCNSDLRVLDVGGSLGSSYFQNLKFTDSLNSVRWGIVEQRKFVEIGKKDFENKILSFHTTIAEGMAIVKPNVILLSSVLSYIETPYELIEELLSYKIQFIFIDRTSFMNRKQDRISIQKVHPSIYPASYPAWIFSEEKFVGFFAEEYDLVEDFEALDGPVDDIFFKGFLFRKK